MRGTLHCMLSPPPKSQKPGGVRLSPGLWGLQLCVLQEALLDQYTHRGESLLCVPGGERDTEKDTSRDTETERDKQSPGVGPRGPTAISPASTSGWHMGHRRRLCARACPLQRPLADNRMDVAKAERAVGQRKEQETRQERDRETDRNTEANRTGGDTETKERQTPRPENEMAAGPPGPGLWVLVTESARGPSQGRRLRS